MRRVVSGIVVGAAICSGCGGGGESTDVAPTTGSAADDRAAFHDEVDGVRVEVADCFVVEVDGGGHFQATVEAHNSSDTARLVTVTVVGTDGVRFDSAPVEVAGGGADAWAVTAGEESDAPLGDAECSAHVADVEVTTTPAGG